METLKVSTKSNPNSVAGAMAGAVRQSGVVRVQVVGAGALNQAVKAVAIARGYLTEAGIDLVCVPSFADIEIDGARRTAIRLSIEDRVRASATEPSGADSPDALACTAGPVGPATHARSRKPSAERLAGQGLAETTTSVSGPPVPDSADSGAGAVRGAAP